MFSFSENQLPVLSALVSSKIILIRWFGENSCAAYFFFFWKLWLINNKCISFWLKKRLLNCSLYEIILDIIAYTFYLPYQHVNIYLYNLPDLLIKTRQDKLNKKGESIWYNLKY